MNRLRLPYHRASRGVRNSRQELKPRLQKKARYWLLPCGLLCLLSYTTQDHSPLRGPAYSEMVPPVSLMDQEHAPPTPDLAPGQSDGSNF